MCRCKKVIPRTWSHFKPSGWIRRSNKLSRNSSNRKPIIELRCPRFDKSGQPSEHAWKAYYHSQRHAWSYVRLLEILCSITRRCDRIQSAAQQTFPSHLRYKTFAKHKNAIKKLVYWWKNIPWGSRRLFLTSFKTRFWVQLNSENTPNVPRIPDILSGIRRFSGQ